MSHTTFLTNLANNIELMEVARSAIEGELIELRDMRISLLRNNGLVVKEKDGKSSDIIRLGPEHAMSIGLKAIAEYLEKQNESGKSA